MVASASTTKKKLTAAEARRKGESYLKRLNEANPKENEKKISTIKAALDKSDTEMLDALDEADLGEDAWGDEQAPENTGSQTDAAGSAQGDQAGSSSQERVQGNNAQSAPAASVEQVPERTGSQTDNDQAKGQQNNAQQNNAQQTPPTIKKEPFEDASGLFVRETSVEEVPEYGPPLLRRPGSNTASDKTTVGWTGQTGTKFINRYGKKSAARYRLEHFADNLYNEHDLPVEDNVSNQDNRLSDQKIGTKWRYTRRHMRSIYGVAWMSAGFEPSVDDLELLNPEAARKRWVRTYILVAWEIPDKDGKLFITMKWEPRSALRTRWGGKQADKAIYQAACEAEVRYEEATTGTRAAVDRTPSVGLNEDFMRHMREQSLAAASSATPGPSGGANRKGIQGDLQVAFLQWRAAYLMMMDVERFEDLSDVNKSKMMNVWALKRDSLLQA